jgi:acetylornithine deacetylase/succinyl-diaminopimelate desuccinylase-like protein
MTSAHDYAQTHFETFRKQLYDLIRIPSISTDPEHADDVKRAAIWLAADMRRIGLQNAEAIPTDGHPIVYGEWLSAGANAPTVLIYGHYDVQPAVITDGWHSEPFEPVERDGRIYARGISDDKGQAFAHLKAAEALLANGGKSPVNLKFLFEGEEESGSTHLGPFVSANRDKLKADVCVISDSGMPTLDQPSIIYALRGLATMELEVFGPATDLHSGSYGGSVHNPAQALAEIIAQLHHPDGSVAVPGFYDDVRPLDADERIELEKTGWSESDWRVSTGAPNPWGESGYTLRERVSARPTLEINGLAGGYFGDGFKTVLPAKAWAKISCRLVADQDPERIFACIRDYVAEITPATVRSKLHSMGGAKAAFADIKHSAVQAAIAAYEQGWGKRPIFMREGGSIPIVVNFQEELKLPVILMGFGLNDDGAHGPNEHFSIEMFRRGIQTAIYFYEEIGKRGSQ